MAKKWTRKAAIERMKANKELTEVYQKYPLTKILVDSAMKVKPYPGYHRIATYYAYKDWIWAACNDIDNEHGWTCIKVIDDLLPPDDNDQDKEDESAIATNNPPLPGLPSLPEKESVEEGKKFKVLSIVDIMAMDDKDPRHEKMRAILESLVKPELAPKPIIEEAQENPTQQSQLEQVETHLAALHELFGDLVLDLKLQDVMFEEAQQLREENEELKAENERLRKENEELKKNKSTNKNNDKSKKNLDDAIIIIHQFSVWYNYASRLTSLSMAAKNKVISERDIKREQIIFRQFGTELMHKAHNFLWEFDLDEIVPWPDTPAGNWRKDIVHAMVEQTKEQKEKDHQKDVALYQSELEKILTLLHKYSLWLHEVGMNIRPIDQTTANTLIDLLLPLQKETTQILWNHKIDPEMPSPKKHPEAFKWKKELDAALINEFNKDTPTNTI